MLASARAAGPTASPAPATSTNRRRGTRARPGGRRRGCGARASSVLPAIAGTDDVTLTGRPVESRCAAVVRGTTGPVVARCHALPDPLDPGRLGRGRSLPHLVEHLDALLPLGLLGGVAPLLLR